MNPEFAIAIAEVGLLVAELGGVALIVIVIGWSAVSWVEAVWHRRDRERQRILLHRLYELDMACGAEFPQVQQTVQYVRGLVLAQPETGDVVAFRAGLRARAGTAANERQRGIET